MDAAPPEPPHSPASPLVAPAATAVRITCQGLLTEAEAAAGRFSAAHDPEALHDFRVALRRVRSQLRAYRSLLPRAAAGKVRRALRELTSATGAARDLEVQIGWLEAEREKLPPVHRPVVEELLERLRRREAGARRRVGEEALTQFARLRRRLESRLAKDEAAAMASLPTAEGSHDDSARFGVATAQRIVDAAAELEARAGRVRRALDEIPAHEARIAAKRLRYLLEPLRDLEVPPVAAAARAMVTRLRTIQEALGDLHDAHVMSHVVERSLVAAAAADARRAHLRVVTRRAARSGASPSTPRPVVGPALRRGLLALDRAVYRQRNRCFERFRAARRDRAFQMLQADAEQLAALLRAPPSTAATAATTATTATTTRRGG